MISGIIYLLAACFFWGGVFVIPIFLPEFSAWEIALGRFFCFGLFSLLLLVTRKRKLLDRSYRKFWKQACLQGLTSTVLCYTLVILCIRYADPAAAVLLFGSVPFLVAFWSNRRYRETPVRPLIFPCVLGILGMVAVNREMFLLDGADWYGYGSGLLAGIGGVIVWVRYVLESFDFLQKHPEISSEDWITMIGSTVFFQALIALVIWFFLVDTSEVVMRFTSDWPYFLTGSLFLGVLCSQVALYCWAQGSIRLPIAWVGQLAIAELIFGVVLVYIAERRMPSLFTFVGIALTVYGVLQGLYSLNKLKKREKRK